MLTKLRFRRAAGLAGITAGALGAARLLGVYLGWHCFDALPVAWADAGIGAGLLLAGVGLLLQSNTRQRGIVVACAVLAAAGGIIGLVVGPGETAAQSLPPPEAIVIGVSEQSGIAVIAGALGLLLLPRTQSQNRRSASVWLAIFVVAIACGNLFAGVFSDGPQDGASGLVPRSLAAGLLLLGAGLVCARPDDHLVRLLCADTALGTLARRLVLAVLAVPATLSALLVLMLGRDEFGQSGSVAIITIGYIMLGLVVVVFSADATARIDASREAAVQEELRLKEQLQQQAARLQETVSRRTIELNSAAETNSRLALVAKHTTNGVIITDPDGRVEWVNPAFERLSGYSMAEMLGQKPGAILQGPETNPQSASVLRQAIKNGVPCSVEILNYAKNGQTYWQLLSIQPIRDSAGRILNFISIQTDVSALRRNEERLQHLAQRLQLAAHSASLGIWEWDAATQRSTWDEHMCRIYGITPAEHHGTAADWECRLHPEDRERAIAAREAIKAGTRELSETFRIIRPDGSVRSIDTQGCAERDANGTLIRVVGTARDVTTEREALNQAIRLNERLRQAEELSAESGRLAQIGGWEVDLATSHVTWSGATWQIHETEENYQPTLETFYDFFPPEHRTTIEAALNGTRITGETIDLKAPLITAKGRHRWVRLIGRTDFSDGRPVRTHGAIQDVTSAHESDEAQRRLEAQLFQAQKVDTVGTLAGGIAHDFNNLLTGIIGYQELMAETIDEQHPAHIFLGEARNASLRARNLVEQILAFSRQGDSAARVPLDLQPVIEDAYRFLRATIPALISIDVKLDEACGQVLADATQMHQVLMNLGSNAAHAMLPDGGQITIALETVRLQAGREATLLGVHEGNYARITFSDTGHGMDAATQQRIFDPFFTTKKAGAGTGLGLAVVHSIIRAQKGAISVESSPGAGTRFFIYLPICSSSGPQDLISDDAPVPRGAGERICVVDDEAVVGRFTQIALENLGYRAVVFATAQEALEALQSDSAGCSVLLTDQTMPGMQGHELAMAVRKFLPDLPITIMSGYFSRLAPQMLAPIGRVELLGKPFTGPELAHAMHRALHPAAHPISAESSAPNGNLS